jgi:hypothetical protein
MTLPVPATAASFGKEPRTRMNDDHSMHIPGISTHRNVNNSTMRPGSGATTLHRHCPGPALTPEYRGTASPLAIIHPSLYFFSDSPPAPA